MTQCVGVRMPEEAVQGETGPSVYLYIHVREPCVSDITQRVSCRSTSEDVPSQTVTPGTSGYINGTEITHEGECCALPGVEFSGIAMYIRKGVVEGSEN